MMNGNNGNHSNDQKSTPNPTVNMLNSTSTSTSPTDGYLSLGLLDGPLTSPLTPMATFAPQAPTVSPSLSIPFQFHVMATPMPRRPHFRPNHPRRFPPFQPPQLPENPHQHQQHHFQHHHRLQHQILHHLHHPNAPYKQGSYLSQSQPRSEPWSVISPSVPALPSQPTSYFPMALPSTYPDLALQSLPLSSMSTSTWGTQDVYRVPEPSQVLSPPLHPLSPGSPSSPQSLALSPTLSSSNRGSIDNAVDLQMLMLSIDENVPPTLSPTPLQLLQVPMNTSATTSSTCVDATSPALGSPTSLCSSGEDSKGTSRLRSKSKYQSSVKERLNKRIRQKQNRKAHHLEDVLPSHTYSTALSCSSPEAQCPTSSSLSRPSTSTSTSVSILTAASGTGRGDGSLSNDPSSPPSEPSLGSSSPSPPPSVISPPSPSSSQAPKFTCKYCERPFERLYNLNAHIRTHTDARTHQCDVCHKAFLRPYDLSRHQRIHTNIRPYTCQLCERVFIRNDAIWRHYRSSHADHPDVPISRLEKRKSQVSP